MLCEAFGRLNHQKWWQMRTVESFQTSPLYRQHLKTYVGCEAANRSMILCRQWSVKTCFGIMLLSHLFSFLFKLVFVFSANSLQLLRKSFKKLSADGLLSLSLHLYEQENVSLSKEWTKAAWIGFGDVEKSSSVLFHVSDRWHVCTPVKIHRKLGWSSEKLKSFPRIRIKRF